MRLIKNCTGGAPRLRRRQYRGVASKSAALAALAATLALILREWGAAFSRVVGTMKIAQASGTLVHVLGVHRAVLTLTLSSLKGVTEGRTEAIDFQEVRSRVNLVVGHSPLLPLSRWRWWTTPACIAPMRWRWRATGSRCFAATDVKAPGHLHVTVNHGRDVDGAGREQQTFLLYGFEPEALVIASSFPNVSPRVQRVEALRRSKVRTVVVQHNDLTSKSLHALLAAAYVGLVNGWPALRPEVVVVAFDLGRVLLELGR
jgi:hypothetical protein